MLFWTVLVLFLLIIYYLIPFCIKYVKLRRDYRDISVLPISKIPLVGNLHQFDRKQHVFSSLLTDLCKQCQQQGKGLFCLWYSIWPIIFVCTGKNLESFINDSKQQVKASHYKFIEPWLKQGLITSKNAKWRSRRRLITPAFHDTQLLHSFFTIFNEQTSIFIQRLEKCIQMGKKDQSFDLFPYISTCTLDIIAETAMGQNVEAQSSDGKNEFVQAIARVASLTSIRIRSPWMWPKFIFDQLPIGREYAKQLKTITDMSRKIIEHRFATINDENTISNYENTKKSRRRIFLDSLFDQMKSEKLSLDDIQEEVDTFMFAGHDTTSTAINFTCYLLASHPDVQAKVHAELDQIFSDDKERPCTMEDTQNMIYLDAVIKESMRVLPPVPGISRDVQEDFICDGHPIRKGTTLCIFINGIHYDSNVFPEPEKFNPDRFCKSLMSNEEHSSYAFIPFSAGSRNCIGQRFALLEEKVILSTLFRRFSMRATQTIDDLKLSFEVVMRPDVPIELIVEHRQVQ